MTADLSVPKRWIEGHISSLEHEAAGAEHARRAALTDADRAVHIADLRQIQGTQRAWREVLRIIDRGERRDRRGTRCR